MHAWSTLFWLEKQGSTPAEWEDGAVCDEGDPSSGRNPRFVLLDGATEAYDSVRWVELLARSFLVNGPPLDFHSRDAAADSFRPWFRSMQETWMAETEPFSNVIEEHKFRSQGSLATLLGCEFTGMTSESPTWHAVALGDTVLFQVRGPSLVRHFPQLEPEDFGLAPPGVGTLPSSLAQMERQLEYDQGKLRDGDVIYSATDAFARWMLLRNRRDPYSLWTQLDGLRNDRDFVELVHRSRATRDMKNDDVALLRVRIVPTLPRKATVDP